MEDRYLFVSLLLTKCWLFHCESLHLSIICFLFKCFVIFISVAPSIPSLNIYNSNGINIVFNFEAPTNLPNGSRGPIIIKLLATSSNTEPILSFEFQAAVPKSCSLQMLSPSSTTINPGPNSAPLTQLMKLMVPPKVGNSRPILFCF